MDLWPGRFFVYLGSRRTPHNDIKAWVKRYAPPICALMADRLPDPTANALNQATFNNLSRMLLDSQIVSPSIFSSLVAFEINYSLHIVGDVTLGPRQCARCWDDDLPNFVDPLTPRWGDILWAIP